MPGEKIWSQCSSVTADECGFAAIRRAQVVEQHLRRAPRAAGGRTAPARPARGRTRRAASCSSTSRWTTFGRSVTAETSRPISATRSGATRSRSSITTTCRVRSRRSTSAAAALVAAGSPPASTPGASTGTSAERYRRAMSSSAAYRHGLNSETTVCGTSSRCRRTKFATDVRPAPRGPWRPSTRPSTGTIEAIAFAISWEKRTYPSRSSAGSSSGRSGDSGAVPEVGMRAILVTRGNPGFPHGPPP